MSIRNVELDGTKLREPTDDAGKTKVVADPVSKKPPCEFSIVADPMSKRLPLELSDVDDPLNLMAPNYGNQLTMQEEPKVRSSSQLNDNEAPRHA
nr:hypothetical protein Iba_chr01cCG3780 [Ipomoea batatas]